MPQQVSSMKINFISSAFQGRLDPSELHSAPLEIKDKDNIELTSGYTSEMVLWQDGLDLSQRMATLKSTNNTLSLPSWFSAGSYQVYVKVIMDATGFTHEAWLDLTIN